MTFVPKAAIRMVNKEKGRKGGIATAQKHSKEWLQARAQRAGSNTRDLYGTDFYSYINSKRKVRRGWPKGKLRKITNHTVQQEILSSDLSDSSKSIINIVLEAIS